MILTLSVDNESEYRGVAARAGEESREHADGRRLARTVVAQETEQLTYQFGFICVVEAFGFKMSHH